MKRDVIDHAQQPNFFEYQDSAAKPLFSVSNEGEVSVDPALETAAPLYWKMSQALLRKQEERQKAMALLRELKEDYAWTPYTRWVVEVEELLKAVAK